MAAHGSIMKQSKGHMPHTHHSPKKRLMPAMINRRHFLKNIGTIATGAGLLSFGGPKLWATTLAQGTPNAEKLGWRLGSMWRVGIPYNSPSLPPFYEAIEQVAGFGLHYIEGSARPKLSKQRPDVCTSYAMPQDAREALKKRLADRGVKLTSYYSTKFSRTTEKCCGDFEFAQEMGIETLVGEPPLDSFDTVEKMCEKYQVNVAVHNHTPPTKYWNPDTILEICKGRSERIGACGDTGHWIRSGLDPVEMVKKLGNRLHSLHLKDMNNRDPKDSHEVAWGTGVGNIRGILEEIHSQSLMPLFIIEYEHPSPNALTEVTQSIKYFDNVAAELANSKKVAVQN